MTRRTLTKSSRGAVATGATATGAASLAALAMGAVALGALAVGALAVGRLTVGRARLRRVEIGELAVGRLAIGAADPGAPATVCRVRAAPGQGDALERLVLDEIAADAPGVRPYRALRSRTDPTCSCSTRPGPPRPPRPAPRRDRASTPSSGRPPSRACSRAPPTLRPSSSGRFDSDLRLPLGSRPDVGHNGAAFTSRICPSTNPRAPACPRQARPRRTRQAGARGLRTDGDALPPSASALARSGRRTGATQCVANAGSGSLASSDESTGARMTPRAAAPHDGRPRRHCARRSCRAYPLECLPTPGLVREAQRLRPRGKVP